MATFLHIPPQNLKYQIGSDTDIGGGRENQDACFIWKRDELNLIVMGVLDGHGREVGKVAAEAAKQCLLGLLDAEYRYLMQNPVEFLIRAHEITHNFIRDSFQKELETQGYQVEQTPEKYLMKRRSVGEAWGCVHGGTSCTLVALVNQWLYIANVGDSTALLCTSTPVLHRQLLQYEVDAAARESGEHSQSLQSSPSSSGLSSGADTCLSGVTDQSSGSGNESVLVLSAEHSPESAYEFRRLRRFRARDTDPRLPALSVVYDSPSHDKSQCYAVFPLPDNSICTTPVPVSAEEVLVASGRGSYFKNVRREWASLVATPKNARFQDALAFTRSLGDLHLHTYGMTLYTLSCTTLYTIILYTILYHIILYPVIILYNRSDTSAGDPAHRPVRALPHPGEQ